MTDDIDGTLLGAECLPGEHRTMYVEDEHRWIVTLASGYSEADGCTSPEQAAAATLALTRDENSAETIWFVYDRQTRTTHIMDQCDFEEIIQLRGLV